MILCLPVYTYSIYMADKYVASITETGSVQNVLSEISTVFDMEHSVSNLDSADCLINLDICSDDLMFFDSTQLIQAVVRVAQRLEIVAEESSVSDVGYRIYSGWQEDSSQLLTIREEAYYSN